ncbi:actin-histidine N-methyltransferase-like isoform X1 [Salvelinus fontinalis]|uniref:actin-histidine N-methyltransferase-like isoform X1 n=1 Tax=Salvelinus fontinalis TaxID=8038 RepID=UPI002486135F|nr:actin-histidine N-methyltransferase-like isoform X1 [Salvelinus fontinalis]XP_055720685.1 actin-histidine N-methyltransferase-like isoform X1 [Salvelinus fontinalis]
MGRKSRVKTQKSGTGATAVVSPKEMMNLISDLLQKCSSAAPSPGKEWEEYIQIRGLVEKIRKKQKGISVIFEGSREEFFPELMAWAQESGASCEGVEIANFAGEGFGLRATKDIKAEELFLWIPRTMLMTVESAKNSVLGPLYSQDRILQAMGNVTLALHLLCERADPSSPWLPYIKTLPGDYDTPLYYEEEEVHHLLFTQAIQDVLSQYKNTARQYAYFYKVIQTHLTTSKLPLKDAFTFDDYRWAVSSVMTRQNQIPTEDGSRVTLALIPLWDMCNHTNGLITTGYNLEDDRCECVALQDYKENEQIYIFYGTRSNAEFVIHNGFFFQENAHDRVKIKLGVSKSERLYAMKAEVLARAGIPSSSIFALHCSDPPISAQLLAFLRVFCMTEEELKDYLVGEHAINKVFTLGNTEFPVSWDNEIKLWTFLETRAALLLQTYKTSSQDDQCALEKTDLSFHSRVAIQLRLAEKQILERVVASGKARRLHFQLQQEEDAPLPRYEESDISLLENAEADTKLPLILRKLQEEDEEEGDDQAAVERVLAQVQQLGQGDAARELASLIVNGDGGKVVVNGNGTDASPVLEVGVDASLIQEASKKVSLTSLDAGQSASPAQEEDGMDAKFTTLDAADPATTQEQEGQTENGGDKATASLSQEVDVDLSSERTGNVPKVNSE